MQISPIVSQTLDVYQAKAQGEVAIAAGLMAKEQQVVKKQAEAIVQLLRDVASSMPAVHPSPASTPTRGIDVVA